MHNQIQSHLHDFKDVEQAMVHRPVRESHLETAEVGLLGSLIREKQQAPPADVRAQFISFVYSMKGVLGQPRNCKY